MPILTAEGCRERQKRFINELHLNKLDAVVISDHRDVYYLTGAWLPQWPICLYLQQDGYIWLASYNTDTIAQVDELCTYQPHVLSTNNPDNMRKLSTTLTHNLKIPAYVRRMGWQAEALPKLLANTIEGKVNRLEWVMVDDILSSLQSHKDADEIGLIRASISADLAAYTAAQKVIVPGANELNVLSAATLAACHAAGEGVYHSGDYHSGASGGPAQDRPIEQGELYIVDAWTIYRGYWCDLSRTFLVGDQATDLQVSIYDHIARIQHWVAGVLKPGMRGTELWRMIDELIRQHPALADKGYIHHAGHGVGLRAHEVPDLNRDREGYLEAGNIVSVEPGGYTGAARYGVRIENMYLITEHGAEVLSDYPMNLMPQKI